MLSLAGIVIIVSVLAVAAAFKASRMEPITRLRHV
jgi:ABC-type antimicrobial peptide transport system permease subunit